MRYTPILRQLNEAESKFLSDYESAMMDAGSAVELDVALTKASNINSDGVHSEMSSRPWVKSLHEALKDVMHKELEKASVSLKIGEPVNFSRCMLSIYLFRVEMGYKGFGFKGKAMPGLKGLESRGMDIDAPHLKWIKEIDTMVNSFTESHPDISPNVAFSYLFTAGDMALTLPDYKKLRDEYLGSDFAGGLTLRDYIGWYLNSSVKFDDNKLKTEEAIKMGKTLERWVDVKPYDEETLYWLTRNYDIHPRHDSIVDEWAKSYVELIKKQSNDIGHEMG